jgi:cytochrome b pre-mRNA-processing protein 3
LLHRLNTEPQSIRRLGQAVFDRFCRDMDANLREMGVSDLAVPRKMRGIGEAFYGRRRVYDAALAASGRGPLAAALARNVFGVAATPGADRLAAYVREAVRHLAAQDGDALSRGAFGFPHLDQQAVEDDPLTPCCDKSDDTARA